MATKKSQIVKPNHIKLLPDLEELFTEKKFSDVSFFVGNPPKEIKAHRIILAASSTIFSAMLYPNSLEETKVTLPLEIKIPDVEPAMFEQLIECMYTNNVEADKRLVSEYISLSKRYDVAKMHAIYLDIYEDSLNISNACKMFNDAPQVIGDANFGLEFIKDNANLVFSSEGFLELRPQRLKYLLKQELKIKEIELLKAVLRWAIEQVVVNHPDEDPDSEKAQPLIKKYIEPMLPLIRFPLLKTLEFSKFVHKWNFLNDEDVYELFTYFVSKENKVPKAKMPLTKWPTESRRGGGSRNFEFLWERCGNSGTIINEGLTHRSSGGGYCCALGDTGMAPGTGLYYWEQIPTQNTGNSWQIAAGVATQSVDLNSYMSASVHGWAYFNHGCRCHNSGSANLSYGGTYGQNAVIGVLYNSDEGTLTFYKDGVNLGVAFRDINVEVWPCSHVNSNGENTINLDITYPNDI